MQPDGNAKRNEVLGAFAAAHPVPDAMAIKGACNAHPEYAAAIRTLATTLLMRHLAGEPAGVLTVAVGVSD